MFENKIAELEKEIKKLDSFRGHKNCYTNRCILCEERERKEEAKKYLLQAEEEVKKKVEELINFCYSNSDIKAVRKRDIEFIDKIDQIFSDNQRHCLNASGSEATSQNPVIDKGGETPTNNNQTPKGDKGVSN